MKNDKPQFTLHKLPEGFIVTSDEKIRENDFYFWEVDKKIHQQNKFPEENFIYNDWKYNRHKVIAQQDQIDFSSLSPEMQKEIGWFDWLRIAILSEDEELEKIGQEYHSRSWYKGVEFGFQKALELLSDRTFSSKDIEGFVNYLYGNNVLHDYKDGKFDFRGVSIAMKKYIQSLSQSSWKVELEMERTRYPKGDDGWEDVYTPKFTNGKIKILKLL